MKIALVTRGFSLSWGGAERSAVNISEALKKAGHEVDVYASRIGDEDFGGIKAKKIPTVKFSSALRLLSFHRNVGKMLSANHYDVVFGLCQFFPLDIYWAGGGVHRHWMRLRYENGLVRAIKYVTSPVHLVMDWLERRIMGLRSGRFVITNSHLVKRQMIEYFGLAPEEVRPVYNGVDHALFNPEVNRFRDEVRRELGIKSESTVAIYVSNNWKRKGLETIIRAMADLQRITLIVAGRGKKARFLRLMDELGVRRERVVFAGQRDDIAKLYGAADFYVLPTWYDPCSNSTQEAMACGLPVITTESNGAVEFVAHGKNGYVLRQCDDYKGLREFFAALKDEKLRLELGARAHQTMKDYTWERTTKEMLDVCNAVIDKRGPIR